MNAANEVAVDAFLQGRLGFLDIAETVRRTIDQMNASDQLEGADPEGALDWALAIDASARRVAAQVLSRFERMA